jgi:hypothetical protein
MQVVPMPERGLRERGADTNKKAAQIVGNLASLTDSKDFVFCTVAYGTSASGSRRSRS